MSLTKDQITPGGVYRVRCTGSKDYFKRQVEQIKAITGRLSVAQYDEYKAAGKLVTEATFDRESKTWTVTLAGKTSERNVIRLRSAIALGAEAERVGYDGPGAVLVGDTYVTPAEAAEYAAAEDEALRSLGAE